MTAPDLHDDDTLEAELVEVESTVVSLFKDAPAIEAAPIEDDEDDYEEEEYRSALSRRLEVVAERPILPPKGHATAVARRVGRDLGRSALWATTHPHRLVGAELRPIGRGIAVSWRAWRTWLTEADFAATVVTTPAGSPGHESAAKELAKLRSGHRKLSTFVALILTAGVVTVWFIEPLWLVPTGIAALALLDFIGRRNPPEGPVRTIRRTLLEEGAPLGALAKQIINRLNEDSVRADMAAPMTVHAGGEYRMRIVHEDAIEPKHLRSLERHLAARPMSLRLIGTDDSGTSELRLPTRDHLAHVEPRPWAPTGSRSIADPADLWVRSDGDPSRPVLAGVHIDLVGTTGAGKALALDTPVPTPNGWSTMGELRDGDEVFDETGSVCRVLKAHPIRHGRPCYEVRFSDGESVIADAEHLWLVETASSRQYKTPSKVLNTEEMSRTVRVHGAQRCNYSVRVAGALQLAEADLPIEPYTLGAWLGDGDNATGRISSPDPEVVEEVRRDGRTVVVSPSTAHLTAPLWRIEGLTTQLRAADLLWNKHIPAPYFRASEAQRRALLAGLLDTDGTCAVTGAVVFAVSSERLARDFRRLVATLGYKSVLNSKPARFEGRDYGLQWIVSFTPADRVFRLPKKGGRQVTNVRDTAARRYITNIVPVPAVPVRCITVDSPNALYLFGDQLIPTHNTEAVQEFISQFGECRDVYPVLVDLTMGPVGPLNRRVLRKTAYTLEDTEALLDWVLAQVNERHIVLHRLAESDDDDAPTSWDLDWGPQIELVVDEYSFLAQHEELHTKVEQIMRIGRKVKVCVVRASQKSGNNDLGSTLAASLVGLKILLACQESDTVKMLSTGHRDRGWSPHEFRPAVPGDARDAGKCFVWGPSHRTPEIHRFHEPLDPGEVKRRDRRREADGLPNLDGTPAGEREALLLSPVQAEVERIFADRGEGWLPTAEISTELASRGFEVKPGPLADELGNCGSKRDWDGRRQLRGYALADVRRAWGHDE